MGESGRVAKVVRRKTTPAVTILYIYTSNFIIPNDDEGQTIEKVPYLYNTFVWQTETKLARFRDCYGLSITWAAFGKLRIILKNPDVSITLKRKV